MVGSTVGDATGGLEGCGVGNLEGIWVGVGVGEAIGGLDGEEVGGKVETTSSDLENRSASRRRGRIMSETRRQQGGGEDYRRDAMDNLGFSSVVELAVAAVLC